MRTSFTIFVTAAAALGLSACSLVVDSGEFTGGDGGIHVDRDGGDGDTPGDDVLQDLIAAKNARIAEWCECYAGMWTFSTTAECIETMQPPDAFNACLEDAFLDTREGAEPALTCQLGAHQQALTCEGAAACYPGEFAQCGFEFVQNLFANGTACFHDPYFQREVLCAREHLVGPAAGACPGPLVPVSTAVGRSLQAGNHFDLLESSCFISGNSGGADVFVQWVSDHTGPVVIDSLGSTYDTTLFIVEDCDAVDSIACNDDIATSSGITVSRIELAEVTAGEPLLVVMEGFAPSDFGASRINFTTLWCLDTPPSHGTPGEGGQVDLEILSQTGDFPQGVIDLVGTSRLEPETCAEGESGDAHVEAVVAWRAPTGGTYRIDTDGTLFDNVLYVRRSCDPEPDGSHFELACDDGDYDAEEASTVTVSLMAEETIIIVVDSKDDPAGDAYQINIERIN
jgi:hypothetical protein